MEQAIEIIKAVPLEVWGMIVFAALGVVSESLGISKSKYNSICQVIKGTFLKK